MKRSEAEAAVIHVLGEDIVQALNNCRVALPEQLAMAGLQAFREDWPTDSKLETLRAALMVLAKEGYFTFKEETS